MTTTVLFIEHLITGLQAGLWLTLFLLSFFGYEPFNLERIRGYETIVAVVLLSLIYPLGLFIDNIADDFFSKWSEKIRDERIQSEKQIKNRPPTVLELLMLVNDEFLVEYMGYIRTRIRICRSAVFNFGLITLASVVFTVSRLSDVAGNLLWKILVFEIVVGLLITALALRSWYQVSDTFAKQSARAYRYRTRTHMDLAQEENKQTAPQGAA